MKTFMQSDDEIIEEGLATSAFSTAIALYMIKMLTTRWNKWPAFKLGLVDNKGKRTEKKAETKEEKESLNLLNTFIIGLRRIFLTVLSEGVLKMLVAVYIGKNIVKR